MNLVYISIIVLFLRRFIWIKMKPSLVKHPPLKHLVICIIENLEARLLRYRYCFLFTFFWPGCRKLLFLHVPRWLFYKIEVSFLKSFMWSGKGFPEGAFILYVLVTFFLKKQFSDNNLRSWTITYSCFFSSRWNTDNSLPRHSFFSAVPCNGGSWLKFILHIIKLIVFFVNSIP